MGGEEVVGEGGGFGGEREGGRVEGVRGVGVGEGRGEGEVVGRVVGLIVESGLGGIGRRGGGVGGRREVGMGVEVVGVEQGGGGGGEGEGVEGIEIEVVEVKRHCEGMRGEGRERRAEMAAELWLLCSRGVRKHGTLRDEDRGMQGFEEKRVGSRVELFDGGVWG